MLMSDVLDTLDMMLLCTGKMEHWQKCPPDSGKLSCTLGGTEGEKRKN